MSAVVMYTDHALVTRHRVTAEDVDQANEISGRVLQRPTRYSLPNNGPMRLDLNLVRFTDFSLAVANWNGYVSSFDIVATSAIAVLDCRAGQFGVRHGDLDLRVGSGGLVMIPSAQDVELLRVDLRARLVQLNREVLHDVAAPTGASEVKFTDLNPVSQAAHHNYQRVVHYLESFVSDREASSSALLVTQHARLLASAMLTTFPNTALGNVSDAPIENVHAAALQRALDFIHDNLAYPIGVRDIARAARVSERGLYDAFHRRYEMSPMKYVRWLRMQEVHDELWRAQPGETTVKAIARRWGFTHGGDFATAYRERFGTLPSQTLRFKTKPRQITRL